MTTNSHATSSGQNNSSTMFWNACREEAMAALHNPFVVGLLSNSLPVESFQHYVAQDAFFLSAFAQAYSLARSNMEGDDEAQKVLLDQENAVLEELKMHSSFAKSWGIDLSTYSQPSQATLAYTSFLLHTASGNHTSNVEGNKVQGTSASAIRAVETVAAMVPCMRLYAFLGQKLKDSFQLLEMAGEVGGQGKEVHRYKEWIDTYASPEFEKSAIQLENLMDRLTLNSTQETLERLKALYREAMRLETRFFSAQPMPASYNVSLLRRLTKGSSEHGVEEGRKSRLSVVFDFDKTCTYIDSSPMIGELGLVIVESLVIVKEGEDGRSPSEKTIEKRKKWDELSEQYEKEYLEFVNCHLPSEPEQEGFNYKALLSFLSKLSEFEVVANTRVENSRVLSGISKEAIRQRARESVLRTGCVKVLRRLREQQIPLHVLSVCWSKRFIEASLASAFGEESLEGIQVHSNELVYDENGTSTGSLSWKVQSPLDKQEKFLTILPRGQTKDGLGLDTKQEAGVSVFIGDSVTDILPLLEADVGIIVGDSADLIKTCRSFGVHVIPLLVCSSLFSGGDRVKLTASRFGSGCIYCANGWEEISAFLGGPTDNFV